MYPVYFGITANVGGAGLEFTYTSWNVGLQYAIRTVDNHDFMALVGEALDTDIGTFIITADAHDPNQGGQTLSDQPPGGTEIYGIGKLTAF